MEWITRLNEAIKYIEKNLEQDISYEKAAAIALTSPYHFQRMFSYIAGISLSEYIRRRRITKAAVDLQKGEKVLNVALKYGYDSPTSFSRAFQNIHGITPSRAKQEGVEMKAFPPIVFHAQIKGDVEMNYRIEKKEEIRIVGYRQLMEKDIEKNFQNIPKFWNEVHAKGGVSKICELMSQELPGVMGISDYLESRDKNYYYVAVASSEPVPEDMFEVVIPANKWAIFPGKGKMPDSIQELSKRIMTEWFPTSGYEWAEAPDIELYKTPDPSEGEFEIWVPVREK